MDRTCSGSIAWGHRKSPPQLARPGAPAASDPDPDPDPDPAAGTVLDTMAHHWAAWRQLSQEYGFSLSVDQLLGLAGKPSTAIMELLCAEQVGRVGRGGVPHR